jgi:hypothetical protein
MASSQYKNGNIDLKHKFIHLAPAIGVILVIGGLLLFIDQSIQSGWIPIALPPIIGLVILTYGIWNKENTWNITGLNILGLGGIFFLLFQPFLKLEILISMAIGLILFSLCWIGILLSTRLLVKKYYWWSLFIIFICQAVAIVFIIGKLSVLIFSLAISLAVGIVFIIWGFFKKRIGLFIPGLLLISIGIGVYTGWATFGDVNGLRDTGIMLVWFSLGWILITVCSRVFYKTFVWWPLIPGGILAMVGAGLYIGGNPSNTLGFLQNTGSIGLVLLGLYLILLKFGLKK